MKKSSNLRFVVGTFTIIVALGSLVITSMQSNTFQSVPVDQLRAADSSPRSFIGQRLRVVGFVGKEPVRTVPVKTPDGLVHVSHFKVVEGNATLAVEYSDALPSVFRAGGPVQVDGVYSSPGTMRADHVLTKCPSKYEAGEEYEASNGKKPAAKDAKAKVETVEAKSY